MSHKPNTTSPSLSNSSSTPMLHLAVRFMYLEQQGVQDLAGVLIQRLRGDFRRLDSPTWSVLGQLTDALLGRKNA